MRRAPIRVKLSGALVVPLLVLVGVTALEVWASSQDARHVRDQTDLAKAAIGPSGLITQLQNERRWSAVELVGGVSGPDQAADSYDDVRTPTDLAISELRGEIAGTGRAIAGSFAPAFDALASLSDVRADVDSNTSPRTPQDNLAFSQEVFDRYTAIIEAFFDAMTRVSLAVEDPELRRGTELADVVTRQIHTMSLLIMELYVAGPSPGGVDTPQEIAEIAMLQNSFTRNADTMRSAPEPFARVADEHFPTDLTTRLDDVVNHALTTGEVDPVALSAALDAPGQNDYAGYHKAISSVITRRADELNTAASRRQRSFAVLAAAVLVAGTVVTWSVSRSITRPLRSLTRQAKDVAHRRLPQAVADILETPLGENVAIPELEPVRVRTRDEVSDVVDALNTVQRTALDLAVEQAVLRRNIADSFVNLGRRNQNLLGRQLDFVTRLESDESDPDVLSNLFRLDHLATRMRRNAESLLVLAGVASSRRSAVLVGITDVVRAALGEVEGYQRVALRDIQPATVIGAAAADLAHMLAELIENALAFSPADRSVDIRGLGRRGPSTGARDAAYAGGYTLAIVDGGRGMSASDLDAANRRLAGAERFTIAPSKYLGHYVAGRLAARHGVRVRLDNIAGGGIAAIVWLPPSVLIAERGPASGVTPSDDVRSLQRPQRAPRSAARERAGAMPRATTWPAPQRAYGGTRGDWDGRGDGGRVVQPPSCP